MRHLRRWTGLGIFALALLGGGCNILSLPFFLAGPEPSDPAGLKQLATEDKDHKIKVAVIASSKLEVREQLARVDKELAPLVIKHLAELSKANEENVVVLPFNTVERYKSENPDWDRPLDLVRIGEKLKVRYVIYLEINALSLYVPKSNGQILQGDIDMQLTLVNIRKPDDLPEEKPFHERFPESEVSVFDEPNPVAFRLKVLDHVAEKIAWQFAKHPTKDKYSCQ